MLCKKKCIQLALCSTFLLQPSCKPKKAESVVSRKKEVVMTRKRLELVREAAIHAKQAQALSNTLCSVPLFAKSISDWEEDERASLETTIGTAVAAGLVNSSFDVTVEPLINEANTVAAKKALPASTTLQAIPNSAASLTDEAIFQFLRQINQTVSDEVIREGLLKLKATNPAGYKKLIDLVTSPASKPVLAKIANVAANSADDTQLVKAWVSGNIGAGQTYAKASASTGRIPGLWQKVSKGFAKNMGAFFQRVAGAFPQPVKNFAARATPVAGKFLNALAVYGAACDAGNIIVASIMVNEAKAVAEAQKNYFQQVSDENCLKINSLPLEKLENVQHPKWCFKNNSAASWKKEGAEFCNAGAVNPRIIHDGSPFFEDFYMGRTIGRVGPGKKLDVHDVAFNGRYHMAEITVIEGGWKDSKGWIQLGAVICDKNRSTSRNAKESKCGWYKPKGDRVILFSDSALTSPLGAVGSLIQGKTSYYGNTGKFKSTDSYRHVRVVAPDSTMHNKVGYIETSAVEIAVEKCK